MNRDIEAYTQVYLQENYADFEEIMVHYRRKKMLSIFQNYQPKRILEIGCGVDSIANYYKEYDSFTIVEPSKKFCDKAKNDFSQDKKVKIINDFIEMQISLLLNHSKMSALLKNQILDEKLLEGLDNMVKYMPHLGAEIFINAKRKKV